MTLFARKILGLFPRLFNYLSTYWLEQILTNGTSRNFMELLNRASLDLSSTFPSMTDKFLALLRLVRQWKHRDTHDSCAKCAGVFSCKLKVEMKSRSFSPLNREATRVHAYVIVAWSFSTLLVRLVLLLTEDDQACSFLRPNATLLWNSVINLRGHVSILSKSITILNNTGALLSAHAKPVFSGHKKAFSRWQWVLIAKSRPNLKSCNLKGTVVRLSKQKPLTGLWLVRWVRVYRMHFFPSSSLTLMYTVKFESTCVWPIIPRNGFTYYWMKNENSQIAISFHAFPCSFS